MHTTSNMDLLYRSEIWSEQLKEELLDDLMGDRLVKWLSGFSEGSTTLTIPSIGQATVDDYIENTDVKMRALDQGEYQFSITDYKSSGHYITDKAKQDLFYAQQLVSGFVPKQKRALMQRLEADIMGLESNQTASNLNTINGVAHRFVGSGTNEAMAIADFARARHSIKKANGSDTDLIAVVDPSVEYTIDTSTNLTSLSNPNPRWAEIAETGIASGMSFVKNIFGFDVYTSNYLADANETIDSLTTASGKANLFMSLAGDESPFVGAWAEMPVVESVRNARRKRDEVFTTCRYGLDLYRPETLVCVLTDTDIVS